MKLSFNIPTYNRANCLAIALKKIIAQIEELHMESEVEINLSDNASTDNTKEIWNSIVNEHPHIRMTYKRNEQNLGPDLNFLSAMHMASGEYSLLWGDDDYLKEYGLKRIFELIEIGEKNDIQLLLSSTSVIDYRGKPMYEKKFMREDVNEIIVDFSDINQVRAYFFIVTEMAGLMSFISDVVYKTDIIKKMPYHDQFTGTHYAFLNYWWGWLASGKKLYCSNTSFIDASERYQEDYGFGVNRELVDYYGFKTIADTYLKDKAYYRDFLSVFIRLHDVLYRQLLCIREHKSYKDKLVQAQRDFCVTELELCKIERSASKRTILLNLLYVFLPGEFVMWLKKKKNR